MNSMEQVPGLTDQPVMIIAGGTGGHVFPALAVAQALQDQGAWVTWLGTRNGIEAQWVPQRFTIDYIRIKGVRKTSLLRRLQLPFSLIGAIWQATGIMRRRQVRVVIGFGGYVTAPGGLAAWLTRRPLILHEQNAILGMANRYLARMAKRVLTGFPLVHPTKTFYMVGNPVRPEIQRLAGNKLQFCGDPLHVLVLGGSLGARTLNRQVPAALRYLGTEPGSHVQVYHQAGKAGYKLAQAAYRHTPARVTIDVFIEDMAAAYEWADVIICRAGASTVAEIAAVGLPALFVPYPYAVDDHQYYNAKALADSGGAAIIRDSDLDAEKVAGWLNRYIGQPQRLCEDAGRLRNLLPLDATASMVAEVQGLVDDGSAGS